jgi:hypothetical protein
MPTQEEWDLVKSRIEQMPSHIKLSIGNASYAKDDLIKHIEKKDEIGQLILEVELTYLKALKNI